MIRQGYEDAITCLDTNYYGVKKGDRSTTASPDALDLRCKDCQCFLSEIRAKGKSSIPLDLKLTQAVLFTMRVRFCCLDCYQRMPSESIRNELNVIDNLNEEKKIEKLLDRFLEDVKNGSLEAGGWPMMLPSYSVSKTALNAYTRVLGKRDPDMCVNCAHPGFVKTDINWNTGVLPTEKGAKGPVMLGLLPNGGPFRMLF